MKRLISARRACAAERGLHDMARLSDIVDFLDRELEVDTFSDSSNNGLQVENSGSVKKICLGVDASMEFFKAAKRSGADLVVCHHGISWNDSLKRITDLNYSRVSFLIKNDIALYACHLPLDAHPRHGNNACICKALGLRNIRSFGLYQGVEIGFEGKLSRVVTYSSFKKIVREVMDNNIHTMDFGRKTVKSVAVVSGGGADELAEAGKKGIDVFLSGEPKLSAYSLAQEYGINAIFAGHYATEVFGVKRLAELLAGKFRAEALFVDLGIPY
jgi:dinuclear metal center YbgI/SA1388 family protein